MVQSNDYTNGYNDAKECIVNGSKEVGNSYSIEYAQKLLTQADETPYGKGWRAACLEHGAVDIETYIKSQQERTALELKQALQNFHDVWGDCDIVYDKVETRTIGEAQPRILVQSLTVNKIYKTEW